MKITVRNRTFPDVPTAAKQLGVKESTVYRALSRDGVDGLGKGTGNGDYDRQSVQPGCQRVTIGPCRWNSRRQCAKDLKISVSGLSRILDGRRGQAAHNGLLRRAMEFNERNGR